MPDNPQSFLTLSDLAINDEVEVVRHHGSDEYSAHLMRMGLIPGTRLTLVRKAPFGAPYEVRVRGFSLALRPDEANSLELKRP